MSIMDIVAQGDISRRTAYRYKAYYDEFKKLVKKEQITSSAITIEQALERIAELESENKALREELERYKNITPAGRRKHDETWMASYNDFVVKYESGMTIMEIVNQGEISRRTAYRYKAYYDELRNKKMD